MYSIVVLVLLLLLSTALALYFWLRPSPPPPPDPESEDTPETVLHTEAPLTFTGSATSLFAPVEREALVNRMIRIQSSALLLDETPDVQKVVKPLDNSFLYAIDDTGYEPFGPVGLPVSGSVDTDTFVITVHGKVVFPLRIVEGQSGQTYTTIRLTLEDDARSGAPLYYVGTLSNVVLTEATTSLNFSLMPQLGSLTSTMTGIRTIIHRAMLESVAVGRGYTGSALYLELYQDADAANVVTGDTTYRVGTALQVDASGSDSEVHVAFQYDAGAMQPGDPDTYFALRLLVGPNGGTAIGQSPAVALGYNTKDTEVDVVLEPLQSAVSISGLSVSCSVTLPDFTPLITGSTETEKLNNSNVQVTLSNSDYRQTQNCRTADAAETAGKGGIPYSVTDGTVIANYHASASNTFTGLAAGAAPLTMQLSIVDENNNDDIVMAGVSTPFLLSDSQPPNLYLTTKEDFRASVAFTLYDDTGAPYTAPIDVSLLLGDAYDQQVTILSTMGGRVSFTNVVPGAYGVLVGSGGDAQTSFLPTFHVHALDNIVGTIALEPSSGMSYVPVSVVNAQGEGQEGVQVTTDASATTATTDHRGRASLLVDRVSQTFSANGVSSSPMVPSTLLAPLVTLNLV